METKLKISSIAASFMGKSQFQESVLLVKHSLASYVKICIASITHLIVGTGFYLNFDWIGGILVIQRGS